jgi:hypothetical protein
MSANSRLFLNRRQCLTASLALAGCRIHSHLYARANISDSLDLSLEEELPPFDYSRESFYEDRDRVIIHWGQRDSNDRPHRLNHFFVDPGHGLQAKIKRRWHERSLAVGPMGEISLEISASFDGSHPRSKAGPGWGYLPGELEYAELPVLGRKAPAGLGPPDGLIFGSVLRYRNLVVSGIFLYDQQGARRAWTGGITAMNRGEVTKKNEAEWVGEKLERFIAEFGIGLPVYHIDYMAHTPREQQIFGAPAQLGNRLEAVVPTTLRPKAARCQ